MATAANWWLTLAVGGDGGEGGDGGDGGTGGDGGNDNTGVSGLDLAALGDDAQSKVVLMQTAAMPTVAKAATAETAVKQK